MVMLSFIPFLPFVGFLINATVGRRLPKSVSGGVACLAIIGSFVISVMSVSAWMAAHTPFVEQTAFTWMTSGELHVPFTFRLDPLASLMILVVTGIGSLIHIYSLGYMTEETDSEYARYFSYLNLFAAFMLVLVLGASFPVMFVGWEGVGLCSYLLIGFWFKKKSAADAGKKAFVVNRIGDFGFILGMLLLFVTFGTLDFQGVAAAAAARAPETDAMGIMTIATLLLFVGATGKSAQIPLYVWLPDAMEGPTPVSALIHAATMVTAGVYMIGRNAVLFEHAPMTLAVVAFIGVATALLAGTIGLVQNDIKRVLAYSTVSQLGYMFLGMGVGAYAAGIFHLYTHAFFKALLFLGSGAVIHALAGEQDIRNMGGLKKYLPITYWTFLIGALAIAGVPALSGFFSKDEILFKTFTSAETPAHTLLWGIGIVTSLLTATYMFRLVFLTFHGERRHDAPAAAPAAEEPVDLPHGDLPPEGGSHAGAGHAGAGHAGAGHAGAGHAGAGHTGAGHTGAHAHSPISSPVASGFSRKDAHDAGHGHGGHGHGHGDPHEAPWSMAIPLILLAVGSVFAGYVGVPHALGGSNRIETFLEPSFEVHAHAPGTTAEAIAAQPGVQTVAGTQAAHAAPGAEHADTGTELMLMAVSSGIAVAGIALAMYFWLRNRAAAAALAARFGAIHRVLLAKYYVDEIYDALVVQPIKALSTGALWKGVDAGLIDGSVNGVGLTVSSTSSVLRRMQTGSIRTYAFALLAGVIAILGYYLIR
jgi:NADH-quinone oxidoreductase subunit L